MGLCVNSEIDRLQRVLVHTPGREIDEMPPAMMDNLLFDDLLYGPKARKEHRFFCGIMDLLGIQVLDIQILLKEAIANCPEAGRDFVKMLESYERLSPETGERLRGMTPEDMADALVAGITVSNDQLAPDRIYDFFPVPNLMFARDPQIVIGEHVVISAMKWNARKRETLISWFIFKYHPDLATDKILLDGSRSSLTSSSTAFGAGTIEGGDLLVLKEGVILVGLSERTTEYGVGLLANKLRQQGQFRTLIMVPMPASRAQMHLDTIFTRLSDYECLIYSPMIAEGSAATLSAISIPLTQKKSHSGHRKDSLLSALKDEGIDLKPIFCGGCDDYILQTREQWTDGANAFALRPGLITTYDRNTETVKELERNGYYIVSKEDVKETPGGGLSYEFKDDRKYAVLIPSMELSRARGGPRCMTMPLERVSS